MPKMGRPPGRIIRTILPALTGSEVGFQKPPVAFEPLNNSVVREAKSSFSKYLGARPWGKIISRCWIWFDRDL